MYPGSTTALIPTEICYQSLLLIIKFSLKKVATIRYEKARAEEVPLNTKMLQYSHHASIKTVASIVKTKEPTKLLVYASKFIYYSLTYMRIIL